MKSAQTDVARLMLPVIQAIYLPDAKNQSKIQSSLAHKLKMYVG